MAAAQSSVVFAHIKAIVLHVLFLVVANAPLRHVQVLQREVHKCWVFVAIIVFIFKSFEHNDQYLRKGKRSPFWWLGRAVNRRCSITHLLSPTSLRSRTSWGSLGETLVDSSLALSAIPSSRVRSTCLTLTCWWSSCWCLCLIRQSAPSLWSFWAFIGTPGVICRLYKEKNSLCSPFLSRSHRGVCCCSFCIETSFFKLCFLCLGSTVLCLGLCKSTSHTEV